MERAIVFLDFANVEIPGNSRGGLDYAHLLQYLGEGRFLVDGYCYLPVDPRRQMERTRTIDSLWEQGWNVRPKIGKIAGDTFKCNVDVEMAIDMLRAVHDIRPDILVLCSGDEDFLPVVKEVRRMGVRVEVASFEDVAAWRLRQQASGFISLDTYYQEWMAERNDQSASDFSQAEASPETDQEAHSTLEARLFPAPVPDGEIPDADRYR
ncbi:MAG: NYN domain-containing protein [Solidesulfovibrio sp.]|uniref:LabA-like NYN domain-containing protein n=1 Tax=Solidesulfovibrio sp. TaxID=2910990 RepID=UPI003158F0BB